MENGSKLQWRRGRLALVATLVAVHLAGGLAVADSLQSPPQDDGGIARTAELVRGLVAEAFPELASVRIEVRPFASRSDYFRTAFAVRRFVFGLPMRYIVRVNPEVWHRQAPEDAIRAILVHELAHVRQLSRGMRIRRFGLVKLISDGSESRFERAADLQTIERGHAPGLRAYREWLYRNVPREALPEKRRHYFSPEEIDAIVRRTRDRPELFARWRRRMPMNLAEIEATP